MNLAQPSLITSKAVLFAVMLVTSMLLASGCGKSASSATSGASEGSQAAAEKTFAGTDLPAGPSQPPKAALKPVDPIVVLHTTQGDITIQLFQQKSPRTVENFLRSYAERGFYDETIFHHVEPGVMLIAGGYTADLTRKSPRAPIYNESKNGLSNRRGTIAMIRDPEAPHSATSEFFVNLADNADFDFKTADSEDVPGYCVFGEVIKGLDVVDRIAQLPTAAQGDFSKVPSPPVAIRDVKRLQ
jgi:peptidyl-prolyl cis-trans isomerase A (cyclophilin A)